ncbi:MAG: tetratricopeptide repeat protein [Chloroflexi bacterium]|nr:tetratricopeptide repeat protein [Chloroflexota bacterium]
MGFFKRLFGKPSQPVDKPSPASSSPSTSLPALIDPILAQLQQPPRSILDMPQRVTMCRQALAIITRMQNEALWAALQSELGRNLAWTPQGDRAENIEQAIAAYQDALQVRTRAAMPVQWASTMNNLATAYFSRIRGDRAENIEQAIAAYQEVLQVTTRAAMPVEWATIMNNLAAAYSDRIRGDRAENIEQSIAAYQDALQVRTRAAMPVDWAQAMNNLALAYGNRIRGDRAENIEQAIAAYQDALQVRTRATMPVDWATTMNNLAIAYGNRIRGDRAENIEQAIAAYQDALQVMTHATMPVDWANTMNNLALAYADRIRGDRAENIEQAIAAYQDALQVRTRAAMPVDWAITMNNLALAYADRIRGDRAKNIEQAIAAYQDALQVMTRATMPVDWATTRNNLALAYGNRIRGDRAENIEQAITAYEEVLQVRTRATMPVDWATTMNNLAIAYSDRIRGDRAKNIEQAIAAYQDALQVMTRATMPVDWATTRNNLALAYGNRIRGDRAENIEQAIAAYEEVLQVRTRATMPVDWATTMNNLAIAYGNRIRGDRAKNIEQAIAAYEEALQVMTRATMPVEWAMVTMGLATAYADRIRGDRAKNIEQAIAAYEEALGIQTVELLPADHQRTQRNLGNLLFGEQQWLAAKTAYAGAVQAGQFLLDTAYTEAGRQAEVRQAAQLFAHSAYCLWQLRQPTAALQQLEQGKTRLLNQTLALGDVNLTDLSPVQQNTMQTLRQAVRNLEGEMRLPPDTPARRDDRQLADLLRDARARLSQQIEAVRAEHPDFMPTGLDVADIFTLIPANGILIAPCLTSQGSFVFIVPSGVWELTADHILPLPGLTTDYLTELLQGAEDEAALSGWLGAYGGFLRNEDTSAQEAWFQAINAVASQLWDALMGPIHQQLQTLNPPDGAPILLMPQGGLGLLPLHAAWRQVSSQPRYFSDDYTVTYAPSAYAVHISRQHAAQPERQARSLFAAINPTRDLKYTSIEGEAISQFFSPTNQIILHENDATASAFPTAAQGHAYIHYSGHGYYHWDDPQQSGLQLADKAYTLADILSGLDLSACRLVTLSACETGITEFQKAPDEYVGLPAGFLQAGAPAVVSTLWAVNDLSTMLLMERFYQLHLQDGLDFASALRQAQLWLRDVTAGELAERFGEERMKLKGSRLTLAEVGDYWRRFAAEEPESQPFEHPYYWAAFTFTGA